MLNNYFLNAMNYLLHFIYQGSNPQNCKPVMLIGNKCDLENDRVISTEQGKEVANELGGGRIGHQETSAKSNINVTEVKQNFNL